MRAKPEFDFAEAPNRLARHAVAKACDAGLAMRFETASAVLLASENAFRVTGEAVPDGGGYAEN